ncbi:MAG: glycosyltransferase [Burkholderiales bacterium]|nr:glycosyltransferase [Burkholderiales bacterium]
MPAPLPRVIHFVTGGFSGATQVAIDLARANLAAGHFEPMLVLRRKRNTDDERVAKLRESGLAVEVVPGWSHAATLWSLWRLCRAFKPALMVAHGFPEHLLGRQAALWAGVPHLVHIEHNSRERYTRWRLAHARWLAQRSDAVVGVSQGVAQSLLRLGMPAEITQSIPNGIDLSRFAAAPRLGTREAGLVMSARFARQKDHLTLIRALALLRDEYELMPTLHLAGSGKASYQRAAEGLAQRLKLDGQVRFLGYEPRVAELLMSQRIFVLSTRWEGMPLALVEAMAAGCACVASLVPGVEGVLEHGRTGLLVPPADPPALALALKRLLEDPEEAERLGAAARAQALEQHSLTLMRHRYEVLFSRLCGLPEPVPPI